MEGAQRVTQTQKGAERREGSQKTAVIQRL